MEVRLIVAPSKENSSTASSPTSLQATSLQKASSEISIVDENVTNCKYFLVLEIGTQGCM